MILDVLKTRYPDAKTAISMGYWFTTAPQVYNGVLYIGSTRSESHIPGGHVLRRRCEDRQGPLALQHGSAGREGSGLGDRRSDLGRWRAQRRRHLGNAGHRSRAGTALRGGRQSVRRQHEASRDEPLHRFDHRARARHGQARSGTSSRRITTSGTTTPAVRRFSSTCRFEGRRVKAVAEASKNGYLYILNRETGRAGPSDQGDAGADRNRARGRAAVADAADSAHGERGSR